jgi:hypothetical protein
MDPRIKSSLLWGVVGALAFLVLLQGYELLAAQRVTLAAKVSVAVVVAVGATLLTYATRDRLPGNESP